MRSLLLLWMFALIWPSNCQRFLRRSTQFDLSHHTLRRDGEANIGVIVNLHHKGESSSDGYCGVINIDSVQQVLAAHWAIDVINNQSSSSDIDIGIQFHDTCSTEELMEKHLYRVISSSHLGSQSNDKPPLLGMIGIGDASAMVDTGGALSAFNIPLVTVGDKYPRRKPTGTLSTKSVDDNVLTTAPDSAGQSKALANVAFNLEITSIIIISSNPRAVRTFLSEAKKLGIRVTNLYEFSSADFSPNKISEFLAQKTSSNESTSVVLMVEASEAVGLAESLRHSDEVQGRIRWLVGSIGLDLRRVSSWKIVFDGGIFIEPHMPELVEFKDYFIRSLQDGEHKLSQVLQEYKEEMFSCDASNLQQNLMPCDSVTPQDINLHFQQDPRVSFVVKAISAFSAAFKLTMLNRCSNTFLDARDACIGRVLQKTDLHKEILDNLKKLSFTSKKLKDKEEATEHYFSSNGHLVANKQLIFAIHDQKKSMTPIGWYSEAGGLHIDPDYVSPSVLIKYEEKKDRSPYARAITDIDRTEIPPLFYVKNETTTDEEDHKADIMLSYSSFLGRTWSLVVISGASIGICVSLWMLIYVTIKIFDRTLHGNQTMGILLLISVVGLFASVVPWLLPPNPTSCYARHIVHPIFIVICFGILLVKSMQLRSLINVGHGGTIPQVNQILSLIFMIAVQIVITIEWYMSLEEPMEVFMDPGGYPVCSNVSKKRFLLLHLYPCLLLLLAFLYGISVIKIRHNYNEGRWITTATLLIIPVFIIWSIIYVFAPSQYQDPSVGVSVTIIAIILLMSIFVPKMNTINKKSGVFRKLKRSGSDTTVYTGFSGDFLHPDGGVRKIPVLSSSSSPISVGPFHHPPPHMFHHHPHHRHHHHPPPPPPAYRRPYKPPSKIRFNGLNYVTPTSYRDWKASGHYHVHRHPEPPHHHFHRDVYSEDPPLIKEMTQSEEEEDDSRLSEEGNNEVTIEHSRISSSSLKKYTASNTNANSGLLKTALHHHHTQHAPPSNKRLLTTTESSLGSSGAAAAKGILSHKHSHHRPHHHHHFHHHHGRHGSRHDHIHAGHRSHSPTDGMILTPNGLYHY